MQPSQIMRITKLDAARRQLRTAIDLWVNDGDPVSIHTLAFAAHQVIHDLNRKSKGPYLLLDNPTIRPEKKGEFISIVKRDADYFKHADDRKRKTKDPTEIEFEPSVNELFIGLAITGLKYLGKDLAGFEIAFYAWYGIQRPDMLTDAGRELLEKSIEAQSADSLRLMKKQEFFERIIKLFIINQSGGSG